MGSKFWQKSHRNLTDIGTEIWKIFFANPAFRDWLHCWLEIGLIYRDTLPKTRFSLASKKQTGFRFDTFTMFKSILNNVKTKTWFPMKFKFASQLNTNLFHAEIQTWFTMKSKFAPRRTGSRFGEIDVALAEERLEPTLGRIIIHCHHLLYHHQCHIFVVTILASSCPPRAAGRPLPHNPPGTSPSSRKAVRESVWKYFHWKSYTNSIYQPLPIPLQFIKDSCPNGWYQVKNSQSSVIIEKFIRRGWLTLLSHFLVFQIRILISFHSLLKK